MPISANTSLYIVSTRNIFRQLHGKQFIQPFLEKFLSSQIDISLYIVRHIPGVLHGKAFSDVSPSMYRTRALIGYRTEWGTPFTFTIPSAHVFCFWINQSLVRKRTVQEILVIFCLTQCFSSLCNTVIIISILQRL